MDRGNIDRVVIGPPGIFAVETKAHGGVITYDGRQLLHDGRPLEKDFLRQATRGSLR